MSEADIADLRSRAAGMRQDILRMTYQAGESGGHIGGSLSLVEILLALYSGILRYNPNEPGWAGRDRLMLSKGHGSIALYAAMRQMGIISEEDLEQFKKPGCWLRVHPLLDIAHGMECASGSLGQGLSFAIGCDLALKDEALRFFVILGDGECNEGQVWEAAMYAAHRKLNNIIAIVDANSAQYDGKTADILNMEDMRQKWQAFGWDAVEVDGHDIQQLQAVFRDNIGRHGERPLAVIARTVKGKGISFMENNPQWHHGRLSKKQFEQALLELEQNHG